MTAANFPERLSQIKHDLQKQGYISDEPLAAAIGLMEQLGRPLLLEGDAGVGKTAVAQALAKAKETQLIRLQCYEGLDVSTAVYEWNVQRQFLEIRRRQEEGDNKLSEEDLYGERFLLKRPLLEALVQDRAPVLLIDEIDRADEEFEAFLLELLSEFQISIPEMGIVKAKEAPHVILTANGTRELSDALRRRCLYLLLDYPTADREKEILLQTLPNMEDQLSDQIVHALHRVRKMDLRKTPGIAETLDWASALLHMGVTDLNSKAPFLRDSFACLFKTREDLDYIKTLDAKEWID